MKAEDGQAGGPVWGIVVAAGSGTRFGGAKQWEELEGRTLAAISVEACRSVCNGVVLVSSDRTPGGVKADAVVPGGSTRSESVRLGLAAVPAEADVIVVHDAARPRASAPLFEAVIAAVRRGAAGAVPGVPITDTLKLVRPDASVETTLDRDSLRAIQTPQAFSASWLRRAHASGGVATDDAAMVEASGGDVVVVDGDPENLKVTTRSDLDRMRDGRPGDRPRLRVGHGFDIHKWAAEPRPLILGGVTLDESRGLAGHSDADVVFHAMADAVLGAAALGDLGHHFPDDDPRWAGARSTVLLEEAVRLAATAGWMPVNGDVTVVAEEPHLAPHVSAMQENLTRALGAPVSVKATRAEALGALGRGEGIAAWAVTLLAGA